MIGFEPAHNGKGTDFRLAATLPTELSMLTTKSLQKHTWLLNMPPKCFEFNVYKQANVNIAIRSWANNTILVYAENQVNFVWHGSNVFRANSLTSNAD